MTGRFKSRGTFQMWNHNRRHCLVASLPGLTALTALTALAAQSARARTDVSAASQISIVVLARAGQHLSEYGLRDSHLGCT